MLQQFDNNLANYMYAFNTSSTSSIVIRCKKMTKTMFFSVRSASLEGNYYWPSGFASAGCRRSSGKRKKKTLQNLPAEGIYIYLCVYDVHYKEESFEKGETNFLSFSFFCLSFRGTLKMGKKINEDAMQGTSNNK